MRSLSSCLIIFMFSSFSFAQTQQSLDVDSLNKRITELEEVQKEQSEMVKRILKDFHYDQSSRGYVDIKYGLSEFSPEDIENENRSTFNNSSSSTWKTFGSAKLFEVEIGKEFLIEDSFKYLFGIGVQNLSSETNASYTTTSGTISVYEKVSITTMFMRYSFLFKAPFASHKTFIGPGITFGFAPESKLLIDLEKGNIGAHATGQSNSTLIEIFFKGKSELSRYVSATFNGGYRIQNANDLRLDFADIVTVATKTDLDASGFFFNAGLAISF